MKVYYCRKLGVVYYIDWVKAKMASVLLLVAIVEKYFELAFVVEALN